MVQNKKSAQQDKQGVTTLRTKFCDSDERQIESSAQKAADQECQYPKQAPVRAHEPFEPHGLN